MVLASIIAGFLGGYEWIIILLAIVLLFGGRKIPELMRGLGKGIREFKDSSKEISKEADTPDSKEKTE
jgi:sec-independent protein translocase protein TatA